ncbi:signal peptidase I [Candidatus Methylacidiphilum infernorum]|uniref:Signal peptidase I n=1 Tax=Candidatus Methylacidiphilum infernorum TaxID=511746 RepID=A0ABX7PTQ0_9BACT|nr:signal peptidase I [Candidatus Methylacidiphilum infernorum]QSR86277.1 signal peptidase I [Candidatus Methylacidiphilum infernorum]
MSFLFLKNRDLNRKKNKKIALQFLKDFRRKLHYRRDLLDEAQVKKILDYLQKLESAICSPQQNLEAILNDGEKLYRSIFTESKWSGFKENIEVLFVALVVALAIRAYFLQPFKIPTDSMKPTLYGIQVTARNEQPPNLLRRILDFCILGKSYHSLSLKRGGILEKIEGKKFLFFEYSKLSFESGESAILWTSPHLLEYKLGIRPGMTFEPKMNVLNFEVETGDQVLVNKFIYHFRFPKRGEVIVFKTTGIEGIESNLRLQGIEGSQYYIKRCVGIAGDVLQIRPPYLLINGSITAPNPMMAKIESQKEGYQGYVILPNQQYLVDPNETYTVPPLCLWAMGDNSPDSLDSRFWGPVPMQNIVGTGFIVYWPFSKRWGIIR